MVATGICPRLTHYIHEPVKKSVRQLASGFLAVLPHNTTHILLNKTMKNNLIGQDLLLKGLLEFTQGHRRRRVTFKFDITPPGFGHSFIIVMKHRGQRPQELRGKLGTLVFRQEHCSFRDFGSFNHGDMTSIS